MANTFALFTSRDNFKNSKKYTYTTSTRTPSWVTELVKHMRRILWRESWVTYSGTQIPKGDKK